MLGRGRLEARRRLPVAPLERRSGRGSPRARSRRRNVGSSNVFAAAASSSTRRALRVVADLEVGVLEIVERVQGVERRRAGMPLRDEPPCRVRRGEVRLDRLLPEPEPREDVRRHVERVRRGRRDLRVGARRGQRVGRRAPGSRRSGSCSARCRDARGSTRQQAVQDRGRLLLVANVGSLGGRRRRAATARRRSRPRGRPGSAARAPPSPSLVGLRARVVRERLRVAVEGADRGDVAALALGLRAELRRLLARPPCPRRAPAGSVAPRSGGTRSSRCPSTPSRRRDPSSRPPRRPAATPRSRRSAAARRRA